MTDPISEIIIRLAQGTFWMTALAPIAPRSRAWLAASLPLAAAGYFAGRLAVSGPAAGASLASLRTGQILFYLGMLLASLLSLGWRSRPSDNNHHRLLFPLACPALGLAAALTEPREAPANPLLAAGSILVILVISRLLGLRVVWRISSVVRLLLVTGAFSATLASRPIYDPVHPFAMHTRKLVHDFVHQIMETAMVPDHPFLGQRLYGGLGILFGRDLAYLAALATWMLPALLVVVSRAKQPIPSLASVRTGPTRRLKIAGFQRERRITTLQASLLVPVFAGAALLSANPIREIWNPDPILIRGEGDRIVIPRSSPTYALADGRIQKFLIERGEGGTPVRFILYQRPDGSAAAMIDACAICPPEGYGQVEQGLLCLACKTVIPVQSAGHSGGCNPVPLALEERGDGVALSRNAIRKTWDRHVLSRTSESE